MSDEEFERSIKETAEPVFERLKAQCREERILQPRVVYGYFPCQSDGEDLIICDADDHDREVERFTFPRQAKGKHLCISDFFRSLGSGEKDTIALTCVTVGSEVTKRAQKLFDNNDYTEYLYMHGLGVESAEALAEFWHRRVREEMNIASGDAGDIRKLFAQKYRGSRYSFGYPACPEMADQVKLFRLIDPERIGCTLSAEYQIHPEQSTSAIVVHHPEAKYFSV